MGYALHGFLRRHFALLLSLGVFVTFSVAGIAVTAQEGRHHGDNCEWDLETFEVVCEDTPTPTHTADAAATMAAANETATAAANAAATAAADATATAAANAAATTVAVNKTATAVAEAEARSAHGCRLHWRGLQHRTPYSRHLYPLRKGPNVEHGTVEMDRDELAP